MAQRFEKDDPSLNPGQVHADRQANGLKNAEENGDYQDKPKNNDELNANNIDTVRKSEDNPNSDWKNNVSGEKAGKKKDGSRFSFIKKKGPLGLIISLILGGGSMTLIGTATGPIAFISNVADDLNDQLASLDIRSNSMLKNKISAVTVREGSVNGCTVLSIRCKFKTLTSKQVKNLAKVGVEVIPELDAAGNPKKYFKGTVFERTVAKAYKYQSVDMDSATFSTNLKKQSSLKLAVKKAQNMKYSGFSDNTFVKKVLGRFGISMKPPELTGTHQEKVDKLMNKAGASNVDDLKFVPVDAENDPLLDADDIPLGVNDDGTLFDHSTGANSDITASGYILDGDKAPIKTNYTIDQVNSAKKSITMVNGAKTPIQRIQSSEIGSAALGAVSVLGYWDLACSIKNTIGAATVAAKVANSVQFAQYAMPIMSLVGSMKAGDISEENAQILGDFFMKTDDRKTIIGADDTKNIKNEDGTAGPDSINSVFSTVANPNYGKNVMDSSLYQMSTSGEVAPHSAENTQFSLGLGISALLSGFANFARILDVITNLGTGDSGMCKVVQNWAVRGIGVIVGIIGIVGTSGGELAAQIAITAGLSLVLFAASAVLNNALTQSSFNSGMQDAPAERAPALWTGMSAIESQAAMSRGMMPGNSEQIVAYAQLQNESKQDYIAINSEGVNPLDISNQYSFLGTFINNVAKKLGSYSNTTSAMGGILSLITGSVSSVIDDNITHASSLDTSRFETCDDISYNEMGIDADTQCNIRYVLSAEDLALDTDEVALYMEDNGYVKHDTETGLPEGYTEPSPSESQGIAMDLVMGQVKTYVNLRSYGDTTNGYSDEYGKFLDYCVYRELPFGETYEESTAIGATDLTNWKTGANCKKTGAPYNYFRIYTFDKTVNNITDDDVTSAYIDDINNNDISFYDGSSAKNKKTTTPLVKNISSITNIQATNLNSILKLPSLNFTNNKSYGL